MVEKFGAEKIVVGIDAKNGLVATKGWVETSQITAIDLAQELQEFGVRWIIHTDVATDGAMKGPNLDTQKKMAQAVPNCQVIASGGVTIENDVINLRELSKKFTNLEGVIIGKALYEDSVSLSKLLKSDELSLLFFHKIKEFKIHISTSRATKS